MRDILRKLLEKWTCCHNWNVHRTIRSYEKESDKYPMRVEQILICTKCGKIQKIEL